MVPCGCNRSAVTLDRHDTTADNESADPACCYSLLLRCWFWCCVSCVRRVKEDRIGLPKLRQELHCGDDPNARRDQGRLGEGGHTFHDGQVHDLLV